MSPNLKPGLSQYKIFFTQFLGQCKPQNVLNDVLDEESWFSFKVLLWRIGTSTGREFFSQFFLSILLWREQVRNAKWFYSYKDDLAEDLGKTTPNNAGKKST